MPCDGAADYRPNGEWPISDAIKGWWCSGQSAISFMMCALVDAPSEADAKKEIAKSWPDHGEWRFVEEKPLTYHPGDRFPMKEKSA